MLDRWIEAEAIAFALVLVRVTAFLVVSPFPGPSVSRAQRAGLAAVLSLFLSTYAPTLNVPRSVDLSWVVTVASEFGCGVIMGAAFRFLYVAAEFLGQLASQSAGLSMASVFNPAISGDDPALGRVVTMLAELLALSAGIHRLALSYLLHSFRLLPVGITMSFAPTSQILTDLAVRSLAVGVQLAMPVISVSLIVHIGLAMIARAAPALQILHVGLSLVLVTGILTLGATLLDVGRELLGYYASLSTTMDALLSSFAHTR